MPLPLDLVTTPKLPSPGSPESRRSPRTPRNSVSCGLGSSKKSSGGGGAGRRSAGAGSGGSSSGRHGAGKESVAGNEAELVRAVAQYARESVRGDHGSRALEAVGAGTGAMGATTETVEFGSGRGCMPMSTSISDGPSRLSSRNQSGYSSRENLLAVPADSDDDDDGGGGGSGGGRRRSKGRGGDGRESGGGGPGGPTAAELAERKRYLENRRDTLKEAYSSRLRTPSPREGPHAYAGERQAGGGGGGQEGGGDVVAGRSARSSSRESEGTGTNVPATLLRRVTHGSGDSQLSRRDRDRGNPPPPPSTSPEEVRRNPSTGFSDRDAIDDAIGILSNQQLQQDRRRRDSSRSSGSGGGSGFKRR